MKRESADVPQAPPPSARPAGQPNPPGQARPPGQAPAAHAAAAPAAGAPGAPGAQGAPPADDFPTAKRRMQEFIPRLTPNLHKGDCGRIAIFGGSFEYTGAPYFAAMSALRLGADLVHVFCCKDAGPVIKSYSPELMVHPCLDSSDALKQIEPWLERFHVLVIGPGLGRSSGTFKCVTNIINFCKKILRPSPPLILDADALHLVAEDINVIKRYPGPIFMTPNHAEFSKLCTRAAESNPAKVAVFYSALIVQKGVVDVISNGFHTDKTAFTELSMTCSVTGARKRCGGQGDILAGCLAALVAWAHNYVKAERKFDYTQTETEEPSTHKPDYFKEVFQFYCAAAYGACAVTRYSTRMAFEVKGRAMGATDIIPNVDKAFKAQFELEK